MIQMQEGNLAAPLSASPSNIYLYYTMIGNAYLHNQFVVYLLTQFTQKETT